MLGVFGGLAVLAAIGLHGVMAFTVAQGSRGLGLRMALGACATDLLRLVVSKGLALTAGGVALGAAFAVASLAACLVPAWRATRTDPLRALRG